MKIAIVSATRAQLLKLAVSLVRAAVDSSVVELEANDNFLILFALEAVVEQLKENEGDTDEDTTED